MENYGLVNINAKGLDYSNLLAGKRAFISTASQGIGKSIALLFAKHGAVVAMGGRNAPKLLEAVEEIRSYSPASKGYRCDLGNKDMVEEACSRVLSDYEGIDILVNTVGINLTSSIHEITDEAVDLMIDTNYKSGLYCARKFIPGMMERKYGSIVNISSIHSIQTSGRCAIYAGTKAAVNATTRAMAIDYAGSGIRVNAILPGLIMSDVMLESVEAYKDVEERAKYIEKLKHIQPLPPGQVEDVANSALFLASEMSGFITGQTLIIDGGASISSKW